MKSEIPRPEIYFDSRPTKLSGSHDCGGGDACGLSMHTALTINLPADSDSIRWVRNQTEWQRVNDEYLTGYSPFHSVAILNSTALALLDSFSQPQNFAMIYDSWHNDLPVEVLNEVFEQLIASHLIVPENIDLALEETPDLLTVWLHLTDRCNLRCSYCYLPHKLEDMSLETGQAAIDAAIRSALQHGYRGILIKYAGGEPILAFEMLTALHLYAQEICQKNALELNATLLSNGTLLTNSHIKQLLNLNIGLMISLDGIGHTHDNQRAYAGGRGSFKDVVYAIDLACKEGLLPDISITVTSRNIHALPDTLEWILQKNLPFRVNFYRENDLSLSVKDLRLDEHHIIQGMFAAFEIIEKTLPQRSLLNSLTDRAELANPRLHTCGAGQSYLVFNQRGQVAKCQMHMYQPITDFTASDPLQILRDDTTGLQNPSINQKEECRTCEWRYWCTGGCPLSTYRATGRYDVKSPNCNIYKAIYPEVIRLEALRLLKLHSKTI